MDRVRFGRALGFGARQAVKTLVTAVDAATAEGSPDQSAGRVANSAPAAKAATGAAKPMASPAVIPSAAAMGATDSAARKAAHTAAKAVVQARETKRGLRRGSRRFGEAVWRPFVRLSGVLWLEVSGVFFGIFALLALGYLWKLRGAWHAGAANAADHRSWMGAAIMLVLFGYFCVSSFVRARRRERRR
jgi:hypothetical protein